MTPLPYALNFISMLSSQRKHQSLELVLVFLLKIMVGSNNNFKQLI